MKTKVSEIALLNAAPKKYKGVFSTILYLDTSSVDQGKVLEFQLLDVQRDAIPSRAQRAVKDGTIVISSVRPNLKHYAFLRNPAENVVVSSGFVTVDALPEKVDSMFLYYALTSAQATKYLDSIASTAVSAYPSFNPEDLGNYVIDIPDSLEKQREIASVLSSVDEKIFNNNDICSNLEAMAKLLYDYWFVQFDFPDESGKPYKSSGGKMVWNDELKREIPAGWEVKSISDISKRVKVGFVGTVDKYYCSIDEGYPIVRPAEMSADGIDYSSLRHITLDFYNKNKKSQVHKNDILISRCGKDGIPNIYDSDEPAQVLNAVIIEPDEDTACSCFINEMLKSDYSQVQISHGTSGSVQGVINTEMIAKIIMPYNYDVVTRFSGRIEDNYAIMRNAKRENQQLASLLEFLLPMLMNGQVKVGKDGV